ncbi:MAG: NAD-dependent epimerase/dehydratase family protein [Proteobacteria bacterium]|nr:NAD-dependent epimerase/dehydratase family protein [Pseudomonadota bacterium]
MHQPSGEHILVTGGAGFIGSTLIRRVIDDNKIVVLDTFGRNALQYHPGLQDHPNLTIRKGSVLDPAAVAEAMEGATMVVHCAAVAGIDSVGTHPTRTMNINVIGTWTVLEAAIKAGGIRRFIDFSTSEVFGQHAWKVSEEDVTTVAPPGESRWTYAASKLATEHMAHAYHAEFGLPVVCLRPFNVYGPRQVGEGAIHHFIRRAVEGSPLTVYGDGTQVRAWCYVDDMVEALCRSLVIDEAVGHSFNIGTPAATLTVTQLAYEIVRAAGSDSHVTHIDREGPDVELRVPDCSKAKRLLGYEPAVSLRDGLSRTIEWYRAQDAS